MAQVQTTPTNPTPAKKPAPAQAPKAPHDPMAAAYTEASKLLKPLLRLKAYATGWRQAVPTGPHGSTLSDLVTSMDTVVGSLTEAQEELADLQRQGFKAPKVDLNKPAPLKVGDAVVIRQPKVLARWATFVDSPEDLDNLIIEKIIGTKDVMLAVQVEGAPLRRLGPIYRGEVSAKKNQVSK